MRPWLRAFAFLGVALVSSLPGPLLAQAPNSLVSLVGALRAEDATASVAEIHDLRQSDSRRLEARRMLPMLDCVEAELREEQLDEAAAAALEVDAQMAFDELRDRSLDLSQGLTDAADAYGRCLEDAPTSPAALRRNLAIYRTRRDALTQLEPLATALSQSLVSTQRANRPRPDGALLRELVEQIGALAEAAAGDAEAHGFVVASHYVDALSLPAMPLRWHARGSFPNLATTLLVGAVGAVSLLASVTIMGPEGPPVPMLASTGYGFVLSGAVATLSALTWDSPSLPLWLSASALTVVSAGLGLYAWRRGDRRRRYLGRGLLIGSGVSLAWLVGGLIHLVHDARVKRMWRRYLEAGLQVTPRVDANSLGLSASGRF
ncbi:MAG: hypothetical protein GXP55_25385 [Deltaproteobacteria bacterium]|nr:hypothetical protein [Deltaproteobacteria bacterium]